MEEELLPLVDQILTCAEHVSSGEKVRIRDCMYRLLTKLKICTPRDNFQISQNVFITLSKILKTKEAGNIALTVEELKRFQVLSLMFTDQEFMAILHELHRLSTSPARNTMIQMQNGFSGKCIIIAAQYYESVDKTLIFRKKLVAEGKEAPSSDLDKLNYKALEASQICKNLAALCARYRV